MDRYERNHINIKQTYFSFLSGTTPPFLPSSPRLLTFQMIAHTKNTILHTVHNPGTPAFFHIITPVCGETIRATAKIECSRPSKTPCAWGPTRLVDSPVMELPNMYCNPLRIKQQLKNQKKLGEYFTDKKSH